MGTDIVKYGQIFCFLNAERFKNNGKRKEQYLKGGGGVDNRFDGIAVGGAGAGYYHRLSFSY